MTHFFRFATGSTVGKRRFSVFCPYTFTYSLAFIVYGYVYRFLSVAVYGYGLMNTPCILRLTENAPYRAWYRARARKMGCRQGG
jgi:hypothetical protein